MKHISRILLLAVIIVTGLTTVSAQTVTVNVRQKVRPLPATATNYLDDPFRYFDIEFYAVGVGDGIQIFFDFDYSLNDGSFYLRTDPKKAPSESITLKEGLNIMRRDEMLSQLRGRKKTNVDFSKPLNSQLLPEGTYQLCVDVYLWTDKDNPAREPISINNCSSYEVCYSGSAPELVSPLAGAQMALNGTMVLIPNRKVNFFWTPVISNCTDRAPRFKYQLKVVKVLNGQNYLDAIRINPTVLSIEVNNSNHAVFDTLRDIKVRMERGALYVAQVQAELLNSNSRSMSFRVANDGKSQPVPFFWGDPGYLQDFDPTDPLYGSIEDEDIEEGEESGGFYGLTQWEGGVEEESELDEILAEAFSDEQAIVLEPKRHYVESDGYYTIPMTNDIEVGLVPTQHGSLKQVSYAIALYDYVSDDVDSITANAPLMSKTLEKLPESLNLVGWGAKLKQGDLYYMQLKRTFTVDYLKYSIADTVFYVNGMEAEHVHDTVSRDYVTEEMEYSDGVFFQWGDDPDAPAFATPQWKAPVDRTGDDIYDPVNYKLPTSVPEIPMVKTFPVSWTPLKNVTQGDEVEYVVNVYELKPGQTVEEAVAKNKVIVTRTVTDTNEISENDTKFFKVFSPQKTYVMTLGTNVNGESDTTYHFVNGNEAIPVVFKIAK